MIYDPLLIKVFILGVSAAAAGIALIILIVKASLLTEVRLALYNNKSYILAGIAAIVEGARQFDLISTDMSIRITNFILVGFMFTFRAALSKVQIAVSDIPVPIKSVEVTPKRVEGEII